MTIEVWKMQINYDGTNNAVKLLRIIVLDIPRIYFFLYILFDFQVDLLSLAMILLSFCHPMYIYFWCRRTKRERSQQHQLSPIYKPSTQRAGLVIEETKRPLKS